MRETIPPAGYEADTTLYTVEVTPDTVTVNGRPVSSFSVSNTPTVMRQTPPPVFLGLILESNVVVNGGGNSGCEVTVIWPNQQVTFVTVGENGVWRAWVPEGVQLISQQFVQAYQTCPDMAPSEIINSEIIPATR